MGILFSRKKTRVTEQDKAILQLKHQRDKLKKYQERIQNDLQNDRELAKILIRNGKNEKALLLLRKKRFQDGKLDQLDNMLEKIERMTTDLEFTQVELEVLDGLKVGNAVLKKLHEIINIDSVEKIMDETKRGIEKQQEIESILHGELSEGEEEDALNELNDLINKEEARVIALKLDNCPDLSEGESSQESEAEADKMFDQKDHPRRARKKKREKVFAAAF